MYDCIIQNGLVVFPDFCQEVDLAITGRKIVEIVKKKSLLKAKQVINAQGCYILPGGIDPHVHVHWPFLSSTTVDNFSIASRAAAIGGTTVFLDFAHPKMGGTPLERVQNRQAEVGEDSVLDYGLHCVITNGDPDTLNAMEQLVRMGIVSFKLYMTYSRRKIMVDDAVLLFAMRKAVDLDGLICVHAENGYISDALEAQFISEGRTRAVDFPLHKPNFVEEEAIERAIFWAKNTGARLYIFHLSTTEGLELVRKARSKGVHVIAETCPQYLLIDDSAFLKPGEGHRFICSPPLRSRKDNLALWEGIIDGTISTIGTDHCTFLVAQKDIGADNFVNVPNGMPGIETRLSLMWTEGVIKKQISPEKLVNILSINPAKIFGLFPQKGCIAVGSDADLVIFDPALPWTLANKNLHMGVDWSPYENWPMEGRVIKTIVRGKIVVENGEYVGIESGCFIARKPQKTFKVARRR